MNRGVVHPFFHPTTVVVVDDNKDFLVNFSLRLGERLAYRLFSSPLEALEYVNDNPASNVLLSKCITSHSDEFYNIYCENLVEVNVNALQSELSNRQRFLEKSVVIVDYDMPGMNGIEFCRLIRDSNVKKILLTGVADEKLAVAAFNEGVIDKFIMKQDNASISTINESIATFQDDYFEEKGGFIKSSLNNAAFGFLLNPEFIELFGSLLRLNGVVEYYLTGEPSGYLMLSGDGSVNHLMVLSDKEMHAHAEVVRDYEGPDDLYRLIEQREVIPYFCQQGGYYSPDVVDWKKYTYLCSPVDAAGSYYYALIRDPEFFLQRTHAIFQYNEYLDSLD